MRSSRFRIELFNPGGFAARFYFQRERNTPMTCKRNWKRTLLVAFSLLFLITGCGGQQAKQDSQEAPQPQDPPLAKRYVNIVISDFTSTSEIKKDYPDALDACRSSLVRTLKDQKVFKSVTQGKSGKKYPTGSLLVRADVSDMRIVHGAARFWGDNV